jgi:hypothetical protein
VNLVLKALEKAGMRINRFKCTFHVKEIEFLGYIMGSDEIKIDLKKSIDNPGLTSATKCN